MKTIDTKHKLWIYLYVRKKISFPLIAIILFVFGNSGCLLVFSTKQASDDVKGVETDVSSLVVKVVSKSGSWDMFKYLCENKNQCVESLNSGNFWINQRRWGRE